MGEAERSALRWWHEWAPKIQQAWDAYIAKKRRVSSSAEDIGRCFDTYAELVEKARKAAREEVRS